VLENGGSLTKVTIILPCFNEEDGIRSTIANLESQSFRDREIIVVDDGSSDRTSISAQEVIDKEGYVDVRVVRTAHGGLTHARNVGISESRGDIIFFAECDCTYEPEYVERALLSLQQHPDASAVCLTGAPEKVRSTLATECITIENRIQHKMLEQGKLKPFYAWVFKKNALTALGGFDEKLFQGEDKDMFRRFVQGGNTVAWVPGVHWWHRRDQSLAEVAAKSVVRGQSRVLYLAKHHLAGEAAKALAPFWLLVAGVILLPFQVYVGAGFILFVFLLFLLRSVRVAMVGWSVVPRRRWLLAYPLFIIVRNFSTAVGYSIGIVRLALLRLSPSKNGQLGIPGNDSAKLK
jgi:glycosyltransferase involved in cell wall biosynthesis